MRGQLPGYQRSSHGGYLSARVRHNLSVYDVGTGGRIRGRIVPGTYRDGVFKLLHRRLERFLAILYGWLSLRYFKFQ